MIKKKNFLVVLVVMLCLSMSGCIQHNTTSTTAGKALSAFSSFPTEIATFSTVDLDGNPVDNEIFSKADLTVVNFWGTYCNPCINELPDLGKWSKSMDDNVQMVGIVVDAKSFESDECTTAKEIRKKTGATYTHLIAGSEFDEIIDELVGVPTTFLVDKDGKIVGEPIVGADVDGYKKAVKAYFAEK